MTTHLILHGPEDLADRHSLSDLDQLLEIRRRRVERFIGLGAPESLLRHERQMVRMVEVAMQLKWQEQRRTG